MLVLFVGGTAGVIYAAEGRTARPALHAAGWYTPRTWKARSSAFGAALARPCSSQAAPPAATARSMAASSPTRVSERGVAMANIMTGEVIFRGPGPALYGPLLLVVLAVFIAGLDGRTYA